MTKFRSIAAVAALLCASSAFAVDGSWNTKYGMIFGVQNIFGNNNASTLSGFEGQVGLQYTLAPTRALRLTLNLGRTSNPVTEGESTNNITGVSDKYLDIPGGWLSTYDVNLGAAYMMRLSTSAIAPYLGLGGGLGYGRDARKYTDDINSDTTTYKVDNSQQTIGLGAAGILGVEWRVHPSISLFAEYNLNVDLVEYSSGKDHEIRTSKATGATTYDYETSGSSKKFLNFDTGIGQGGLLGMVAYF